MDPVIFRQYDIRGITDLHITPKFSYELGVALVKYMSLKKAPPIVTVGHDARLSSPKLYESLIKGLSQHGADVIKLGLITTPISYYSTYAIDNVTMSVIITASHNPAEYNGFKLTYNKSALLGSDIEKIKSIMNTNTPIKKLKGHINSFDIITSYINHYSKEFKNLKDMPIILDCGNGTAGVVIRKLMEKIGLNCEILFETPDGTFPNHHPDPTVETNLTVLKQKVVQTKAIAGIGFDGDSDRIGVVDEAGKFVPGDKLLYLFAKDILLKKDGLLAKNDRQKQPNVPIIADVKCSDKLFSSIEKMGGKAIMSRTGHSLIKNEIKKQKAPLGGEFSGHICFNDRNYGYDDGIYASLRLLEILNFHKKPLSFLLKSFPHTCSTPEIRLEMAYEQIEHLIKKIKERFKHNTGEFSTNHIDGVRISFKDGWALIRASNTGPILTLRFESDTQTGLARIKGEIESFMASTIQH